MDPMKSATEMGNKLQSGEEPVSGEMGKGTAEQRYDQGNAEGESHSGIAYCNILRRSAEQGRYFPRAVGVGVYRQVS